MRNPNLKNAPNPKGRQKRRAAIDEVGPGEQQGHAIAEAVRAFRPSRPPGRRAAPVEGTPTIAPPQVSEDEEDVITKARRLVASGEKLTPARLSTLFSGQTFKARAPVRVSMGYEEGES